MHDPRKATVEDYRNMGWGDESEEFQRFMQEVDDYCQRLIALSIHDLPDQDFASAFEEGMDPREFVREVLEEEGFIF